MGCFIFLHIEDSIATSGVGVYYNVHRWYSPTTGRYTRPDPLGLREQEENVYLFVRANPLISFDPLGLITWRCRVGEVSVGHQFAGAGFFVDCDSGCVGGRRTVASYGIGAGGLGEGAAVPFELGYWDVDDGAPTVDPGNLEGPFSYRGCSITIGIGVALSEVNQGKGRGSFSFAPSFGLGAGCLVVAGGSELLDTQESCCLQGR